MTTTTSPRFANDRAEKAFQDSNLCDGMRQAIAQEAHYLMNVGAAPRYSDAVRSACHWYNTSGEFTSPLATALAVKHEGTERHTFRSFTIGGPEQGETVTCCVECGCTV